MTSPLISDYSSTLFDKLHQQIKPFENLGLILAKIEMDSTLQCLTTLFTQIFEKEVSFGLRGNLTRTDKHAIQSKEHRLQFAVGVQRNYVQRKPETADSSDQ